jgi:hypothetical protein
MGVYNPLIEVLLGVQIPESTFAIECDMNGIHHCSFTKTIFCSDYGYSPVSAQANVMLA